MTHNQVVRKNYVWAALLIALLLFAFALAVSHQSAGAAPNLVSLCHQPSSSAGEAVSIGVSENAVSAHLAHGDYVGTCENPQLTCGFSPVYFDLGEDETLSVSIEYPQDNNRPFPYQYEMRNRTNDGFNEEALEIVTPSTTFNSSFHLEAKGTALTVTEEYSYTNIDPDDGPLVIRLMCL